MYIWELQIIGGPFPVIVYSVAAVLLVVLLARRWRLRSVQAAIVGAALGAGAATIAVLVANLTKAFGDDLPDFVLWWSAGALALVGFALGGIVGARVWRAVVSVVAAIAFALAGAVAINATFGLDPTLGSVFGLPDRPPITLPTPPAELQGAPAQPLSTTWTAPEGMPAKGQRGSAVIPGTASGFDARPAGVYLPPAALVPNTPALPLVIMMMGHPGNPDPTVISDVLDAAASQHDGLAPIVIVADQLGASGADTACADSAAYGNARTYVSVDVVAWAKANLNIIDDPAYWTIAGYSNGGGCALTFGVRSPQLWKNILSVSGEPYGGSEQAENITKIIYGGSAAAFEASKPVNIMAAAPAGTFQGMTAIFTAGADDPEYIAAADGVAAAAKSVGMTVVRYDVPGAGHTGDALKGGLIEGFAVLYPLLGLSTG